MAWQQRVYDGVPKFVCDGNIEADLGDSIFDIHLWGDEMNLWGIYPGLEMPKGTKVPDFPYNRMRPEFILSPETFHRDHHLRLNEKGLERFILTVRPNPFYNPQLPNDPEEPEKLNEVVTVGKGKFEDFLVIGRYGVERLPKIAEEITWQGEPRFFPKEEQEPGLVIGRNYRLQVDMKKYQRGVSGDFYSYMKRACIARAAISMDEGGLTAEQIRDILSLIEQLNRG